jgi:membrane protease subunit (stomatin/prohibitin family)
MSLFTKNPNETAFAGGKKHWVDVIKNTDINGNFIWRQPEEDFNTNSTLIVMPGEEALFVKGGTIEQVFQNGTYKLDTQNYPFISRLRNMFSGGISTFNCVVYFIRKTHSLELKWGTVSPLSVYDRQFAQLTGITSAELKLRARGSYKLQIENGAKLLTKMMGNGFSALSPDDVEDYCSEQFQEEIRSSLTDALNKTESGLIGIESRLKEFSGVLNPVLAEIVIDYGLSLVNFSISALELDEESKAQRRTYDEAILSGSRDVIAAQAKRASVDALGRELYQFDRGADILESLAENPGAGGVASAGAGLGMGLAAGNIFSGMAQSIFTPLNPQVQNTPAQPQGSGRFATKTAGTSAEQATSTGNNSENDPVITLKKLKEMLDMGLITQDVYNAKQSEILSRM